MNAHISKKKRFLPFVLLMLSLKNPALQAMNTWGEEETPQAARYSQEGHRALLDNDKSKLQTLAKQAESDGRDKEACDPLWRLIKKLPGLFTQLIEEKKDATTLERLFRLILEKATSLVQATESDKKIINKSLLLSFEEDLISSDEETNHNISGENTEEEEDPIPIKPKAHIVIGTSWEKSAKPRPTSSKHKVNGTFLYNAGYGTRTQKPLKKTFSSSSTSSE